MRQETKIRIRKELYSDLADEINMLNDLKSLTPPPTDLIEISQAKILQLRQKLKDLREGNFGREYYIKAKETKLD